jgi:hypothetical protein
MRGIFHNKKVNTRITVTQKKLDELTASDYNTLHSLKLTKKVTSAKSFPNETTSQVTKYYLPAKGK